MNNTKPTIDGKPGLLAFVKEFNPRHEHTVVALEKSLRRFGFEVTDSNEDRIVIAGPLGTNTNCKTLVLYGGAMRVRHLELIKALERLLEVGQPVWKTEFEQFDWHCKQLELCDSFQVSALEQFETREDMESHIETCASCQPASKLLAEAVSYGSQRYSDQHIRQLIEKSHADPAGAVEHYTQLRDSHRAPFLPAEKPQRAKREQVPA